MKINRIYKWFTLIELLISISILAILVSMTYAPYNLYQNKSKLNNSVKTISQSLSDARNLAINWLNSTSSWNLSVWVFLSNSWTYNNKIDYYTLSHEFSWSTLDLSSSWTLYKTKTLEEKIQIDSVNDSSNMFFLFNSISWDWVYYSWTSLNNMSKIDSLNWVLIKLSFAWSSSELFNKELTYYPITNIVDY